MRRSKAYWRDVYRAGLVQWWTVTIHARGRAGRKHWN